MAVSVDERFAFEAGQLKIFRADFKKFAEQKSLARQSLRAFVMRKQVEEFVAEDGDTTGFQTDDGNPGFDFRSEFVENLQQ